MTTTQQTESIGFTVHVEELNLDDFKDIASTCTDYLGNMETHFDWQNRLLLVSIVDDYGEVEQTKPCSFDDLQLQLFYMAFEKGWFEKTNNINTPFKLDLGQFDPFDLGDCVQLAAFGDLILA